MAEGAPPPIFHFYRSKPTDMPKTMPEKTMPDYQAPIGLYSASEFVRSFFPLDGFMHIYVEFISSYQVIEGAQQVPSGITGT